MNKLIINLKKPMDRRGRPEWPYKIQAIQEAGRALRAAIDALNPRWLSLATLVPVPPSKVRTDPMYDDRMLEVLQALAQGIQVDIREIVLQRENMDAAHGGDVRPCVENLVAACYIDANLVLPPPRVFGIIDDVLTTGSHFKAVQKVLRARFPGVETYGIFIARRIPDTSFI
jgi:predicted amidophosphoribosyltransferase